MADNDKTTGARRRPRNTQTDDTQADKTVGARRRARTDTDSGEADAHATGRASRAEGAPRPFEQQGDATLRSRIATRGDKQAEAAWPDTFELDGKQYRNEGVLSNSSGEAIVFTVTRNGKKYALKVYYYDPDHRPNHALLEKIRQLGGSGLLVSIVAHGEWNNPARPGEKNDYELMDFCEGGSLDGVVLHGDEKALTEAAVRMASAIDFLSKHGILHRDIKPANFFYADKERTQIVLADFGISTECPTGGYVKIDEMRSPVYAAPEFYTNVPGEPAEVGVESDYFALGVSLLCLWMGKDKLTANESQLLRSKLNETLPMPKDMSEHTVSLIKALTRLKMSDRATFDDIRRWAQGETLGDERATADTDFRVVFNSARNEVATSPSELAHYLIDDPVLGKKYIYSGRVTRWLEETGRNEVAVNVEEIAEKVYPSNQEAGLWAVAYMLDPALGYVAPDGTEMDDPAEIARYIFINSSTMSSEVTEKESRLMVYLRALKLDKTITALRDFLDSDDSDYDHEALSGFVASYYLAVLLNDDLTFPVSVDDDWEYVNDVDELLAAYHSVGDLDKINRAMLTSPAFIVWLSYQKPELAGKVRMLHDNAEYEDVESPYYLSSSAYRIAYELDPRADYDFGTDTSDPDRVYSVEQVGAYLNSRLCRMARGEEDDEGFAELFSEMDDHPLGHYLRARGESFMNFLAWNRYCMDTESEDNTQKAGPYDAVTGAYKSVAGFLGHAPVYELGDTTLTDPEQLKKLPRATVEGAMGGRTRQMPAEDGKPVAWLDAWLTVFFQENPHLDLSVSFTYEKETARYIEFIGKLCPDDYYYKRYAKALKKLDTATSKLRRSDSRVKGKRMFFLILGGVPSIATLVGSWLCAYPDVNPISGHFMMTAAICIVALIIGLTAMLDFGSALIPGVIGGLVCATIAYAGFALFPSVLYLVAGAVLLIGGICAAVALFKRERVDTGGATITCDAFEFRQLDALHYAYRQQDDSLDTVVTQYSEMQRGQDETTRENIGFVGWIWAPVAWMIFLIWFFATPQVSGSHAWVPPVGSERPVPGKWAIGKWDARYAGGSTRIVCNIDSVSPDGKHIFGTMVIAGQAPVAAKGTVSSRNDTLPGSFSFHPEGTPQKRTIDAEYSSSDKTMVLHYTDRHGVMHQMTLLSSPLEPAAAPQPKKSGSKAGKQKSGQAAKEQTAPQEQATEKTESDNLLENETSPVSGLWQDTM